LTGNTVVLAATEKEQTAFPYTEKQHGLFTYFLLQKLQETKGDVTLGELVQFITARVKQTSIVVEKRELQTPTVQYSPALTDKWQNLKLR
jgi:hypothetical protein